jgi:hypothetical protein
VVVMPGNFLGELDAAEPVAFDDAADHTGVTGDGEVAAAGLPAVS